MGKMTSVFAGLERSLIRSRVVAGRNRVRADGNVFGRPQLGRTIVDAIRQQRGVGNGILEAATIVGAGSGTAQRKMA
jgi:DNA invertase Pin-like site-specific DNA recombinase